MTVKVVKRSKKSEKVEVEGVCDHCVDGLKHSGGELENVLRGCFMKRITRNYDVRCDLSRSGRIFIWKLGLDGTLLEEYYRFSQNPLFNKTNILKYYNSVKKTIVVPLRAKIGTLKREWEKFSEFTKNMEGYVMVEKMLNETSSVLVQLYEMVREYINTMPVPVPELETAGTCPCDDIKKLIKYVDKSRIFIDTYYGACVYSRRLVQYGLLQHLSNAIKYYVKATRNGYVPINTEHWRYIENDDHVMELQVKGAKKWLTVYGNQGSLKYSAQFLQEVVDEMKRIYLEAEITHDSFDKINSLNEIIKNTLDLESAEDGKGDDDEQEEQL